MKRPRRYDRWMDPHGVVHMAQDDAMAACKTLQDRFFGAGMSLDEFAPEDSIVTCIPCLGALR